VRGFDWEVDWQQELSVEAFDERSFIREAAWVILCSGFSERVVRSRFAELSEAFLGWVSARSIWNNRRRCRAHALSAFGYAKKIDAILTLAGYTARYGFGECRRRILDEGLSFLQRFPYLGPATGRHLAKNLGLPVAKPDRHLVRIAASLGYPDVADLCSDVATIVGDSVAVVDIVFWRYATLVPDYSRRLAHLTKCSQKPGTTHGL